MAAGQRDGGKTANAILILVFIFLSIGWIMIGSGHQIALAVFATVALGTAAMQALHAQAKPKAYYVVEIEVLDAAAQAAYAPVVQAVQRTAGGRPFRYCWGKDCWIRGGASQECRHHRMGQPGAAAGIPQLGSL